MATQLQPQDLDVKITKITNKTVTYELTATGQEEKWKIPAGSTFSKSNLVLNERYRVISSVIQVKMYDFKTRKYRYKDRYDWVSATVLVPKAKLVARTYKQRQASDALATTTVADGSLFGW